MGVMLSPLPGPGITSEADLWAFLWVTEEEGHLKCATSTHELRYHGTFPNTGAQALLHTDSSRCLDSSLRR